MSDLLSGFEGLMKGLSGLMPQDDPDVMLIKARSDVSELQSQETALYAQIGRQALAEGLTRYPELENKLHLVQQNLSDAQSKLKSAQSEKEAKEAAERAEDEKLTCSSCGNRNPDGVKFCQECGAKLGGTLCKHCGVSLSPGTRYCGECGTRQEE